MACPASLPGMSVFVTQTVVIQPPKEFAAEALEEAAPDLAW
jgi:hypothetical protein